jgi:hypothetical protein
VDKFLSDKASGNANLWTAQVGECIYGRYPKCSENGLGKRVQVRISRLSCTSPKKGFYFQVLDAQVIETGFPNTVIAVWKTEKFGLVENWIWPICLFNKGNQLESTQTHDYRTFYNDVSIFLEANAGKNIQRAWF